MFKSCQQAKNTQNNGQPSFNVGAVPLRAVEFHKFGEFKQQQWGLWLHCGRHATASHPVRMHMLGKAPWLRSQVLMQSTMTQKEAQDPKCSTGLT